VERLRALDRGVTVVGRSRRLPVGRRREVRRRAVHRRRGLPVHRWRLPVGGPGRALVGGRRRWPVRGRGRQGLRRGLRRAPVDPRVRRHVRRRDCPCPSVIAHTPVHGRRAGAVSPAAPDGRDPPTWSTTG